MEGKWCAIFNPFFYSKKALSSNNIDDNDDTPVVRVESMSHRDLTYIYYQIDTTTFQPFSVRDCDTRGLDVNQLDRGLKSV